MRTLRLFLLITMIFTQPVMADGNIQISNAWINEAPPTVKMHAGYLTIQNLADEDITLVSAQSPSFNNIEFHNTEVKDGIASMSKQDTIIIPAHTEFHFSPGANHLMLFNNTTPLNEGDKVTLELTFSSGETIPVEAKVKRADSSEQHHHH